MKKMILSVIVLFTMSFVNSYLFAQNVSNDSLFNQPVVTSSTENTETEQPPFSVESSSDRALTVADLQTIVSALNENKASAKSQKHRGFTVDTTEFFVPLSKKSNKGHLITQRVELSFIAGKDRDPNEKETQSTASYSEQGFLKEFPDLSKQLNYGANFAYSVIFIPGYKQDDKLVLNHFGFGYSLGVVCQFDNNDDYGVTCDLLGKVGFETGFAGPIGVGADFLFGGGKSVSYLFNLDVTDKKSMYSRTVWCPKVGTQVWLKLNFLTSSVKNFDIAVFTRFVYSFDQDKNINDDLVDLGMLNFFQEESWQFGVTLIYAF